MKCNNCGNENASGANYCTYCNTAFNSTSVPVSPPAAAPIAQSAYSTQAAQPAAATPSAPAQSSYAAPSYQPPPARSAISYSNQHPYYPPYAHISREKQPFTITDAYIIIGFVLAIVGIFAYAFILLPASIGFSVVGFVKRTNARTLGLSIAGIVVGVVACLIKVGMVLNELGVIPDWLSAGIFW